MAPPSSFFAIGIVSILLVLTKARATVPIFVFGDSLADNGNNNNLNVPLIDKSNFPYNGIDFPGRIATGRFSNGFNSIDFIAKHLGFSIGPPSYASITKPNQMLRGVNFASAGSGIQDYTGPGTINMATQIKNFENVTQVLQQTLGQNQAERKIASSLLVIITANNDMFEYFYATGAANSTTNEQFINNLVDRFIQHLTSLYNSGARKFYIAGTAQVGCVPFLTSRNPAETCIDIMNQLSMQYNSLATLRIRQLSSQLPEMTYSYSNVYRISSDIRENPTKYGITDIKNACCGGGKFNGEIQCTKNATYCSNRNNHFFWDWFHPTQAISRITARSAFYGSSIYSTPNNIKKLVMGSQYIQSY
ncbi:GDSL esterase/lipase [Rhynchospora pubera]|uniref:GDSL esterase/lipase n=1 Tax=Rhynchospora pubera TaxID=906938 RepID=A0AAV8EVM1_9POAL|nr:GDSL esterase/lipase [Rhynchospora pubera]